jgi:hypothetical protein
LGGWVPPWQQCRPQTSMGYSRTLNTHARGSRGRIKAPLVCKLGTARPADPPRPGGACARVQLPKDLRVCKHIKVGGSFGPSSWPADVTGQSPWDGLKVIIRVPGRDRKYSLARGSRGRLSPSGRFLDTARPHVHRVCSLLPASPEVGGWVPPWQQCRPQTSMG